ncbi:MAG: MerR family DNA-binding transcriptional regulator [Planctomycetes bacterium]|nr:MerR family DNA-binding transcriptional regulator [Planctomycetota bacterium]
MTTFAPERASAWAIPPKRYRIGEIVQHTGLSRQTIHNYTLMGLIHESDRTPGGHRLYDESVFEHLAQIASMKRTKRMEQIVRLMRLTHQHVDELPSRSGTEA